MTTRRPLWTFSLVLLAGPSCVHADHLLVAPDACIRQGIAVEVLSEPPARPFTEIAIVEAGRDSWWSFGTWEQIRRAACREAQKVGADALVHPRIEADSYSVTVGALGKGGTTKRLVGIAIRYDDE